MKQAKRRRRCTSSREPEFWKILKRVDVYTEPELLDFILDSCAQQLTEEFDREILKQLTSIAATN